MEIKEQQENLVHAMRKEILKEVEDQTAYLHSVWFQPSSGRFLFFDGYTRYEVVEPLILNKILVFKEVNIHQGELMLRYVLSGDSAANETSFFDKFPNIKRGAEKPSLKYPVDIGGYVILESKRVSHVAPGIKIMYWFRLETVLGGSSYTVTRQEWESGRIKWDCFADGAAVPVFALETGLWFEFEYGQGRWNKIFLKDEPAYEKMFREWLSSK